MAGCEITTVYAGIAGGHIKGFNSHGIVAVKDKEVREADIARVIDAAKAVAIPLDREVIHVLPQEFIIDDQDGINEPLGMAGVRLEAKVHIVTGAVTSAQNIIKCANRTGLNVADIVLEPLASARGGAHRGREGARRRAWSTSAAAPPTSPSSPSGAHRPHRGASPSAATTSPTTSPSACARPTHEAERIKQKYGCAMASMVDKDETIEVPARRRPAAARARAPDPLPRSSSRASRRSSSWCSARSRSAAIEDLLASGVVITGGSTLLAGHAGAGRGGPRPAGAPRHAARHRRPGRRGEEPDVRHRRRPGASTARKHAGPAAHASASGEEQRLPARCRTRMQEWLEEIF